ncbi:MAG TPA: homoserine O-succinyltransferase [Alphaproteobacteria bacterium]|nr:homoserine O-succinyltransferase [Alphaproteobacteria bacterium]
MTILLHPDLPAFHNLAAEGVSVSAPTSGSAIGMVPLRIALFNLMPNKVETEAQFARVLAGSIVPVELTLALPDTYQPRHVSPDHLKRFYRRFSEVAKERFDGMIVTGAPVETMKFEEVDYWPELKSILDWGRENARSIFAVCWAGQAALQHFHGVPKHPLIAKKFGIYRHRVTRPDSLLLRGIGAEFPTPVSRHTEVRAEDISAQTGLEVLAESAEAGLCLAADPHLRLICMFNHLEYDADTLRKEWLRDRALGRVTALPKNYFPGEDPQSAPVATWSASARRLFGNWLEVLHSWRSAHLHPSASDTVVHNAESLLVGCEAAELSVRVSGHPGHFARGARRTRTARNSADPADVQPSR